MTKEVLVMIEGIQFEVDEEANKVKVSGEYHYRNGKHFIHYDEVSKDDDGITRNAIKIAPDLITITKVGACNTTMVFDIKDKSISNYNTPFCSMLVGIHTTSMEVIENEDELIVKLLYALEINDSHISNSSIQIIIQSINESIKEP